MTASGLTKDALLARNLFGLDREKGQILLNNEKNLGIIGFTFEMQKKMPKALPENYAQGALDLPENVSLSTNIWLAFQYGQKKSTWQKVSLQQLSDCTLHRIRVSRCNIDIVRGSIEILGWVTFPATIDPIIGLYFNGVRIAATRVNVVRHDVTRSHSLLPPKCGFRIKNHLPDGMIEDLIAKKAVVEARMIGDGRTYDLLQCKVDDAATCDERIETRFQYFNIKKKVDNAPLSRILKLLKSNAFRRRWAEANKSDLAWLFRELLVARAIDLLSLEDEIPVRLFNGDVVYCSPLRDKILARRYLIEGGDEIGFIKWLTAQACPGGRAMDIGAAYGVMSRALARAGMDVIAVEPDPRSRERIKRAGLDFSSGRINLVPYAITDRDGDVTFAGTGISSPGGGKIINDAEEGTVSKFLTEVSSVTAVPLAAHADNRSRTNAKLERDDVHILSLTGKSIDSLCEELGVRDLSLLKIDIEGGELMAFRGAKRLLDGAFGLPPVVMFEYSHLFPTRGGEVEDIFETFAGRGWKVFRFSMGKSGGGELIPVPEVADAPHHDNLIAVPPGRTLNPLETPDVRRSD